MRNSGLAVLCSVFIGVVAYHPSCYSQGPLTPPGPPAPTFKTLQQVEPRIPITNATSVTINSQGSYYLTTNITVASGDGVFIGVPNVTLDLNGFMISSTANPASGRAIVVTQHDTTILNGHISGGVTNASPGVYNGPGFTSGINWFAFNVPFNVRVSGLTISGCQFGINLATNSSTVVESCTMQGIGFYGIYAGTVANSVVLDCGDTAIFGDTVSNCRGTVTGPGAGIKATIANNCYGSSSGTGTGVFAVVANSCYGVGSSGDGIFAETATNCRGTSNTGYGIHAVTALNCSATSSSYVSLTCDSAAENCSGRGHGTGIYTPGSANNCLGTSLIANGISAGTAVGCNGSSASSSFAGIFCYGTAIASAASGAPGGTAFQACIAIGCVTGLGTNNISCSKWLGTL